MKEQEVKKEAGARWKVMEDEGEEGGRVWSVSCGSEEADDLRDRGHGAGGGGGRSRAGRGQESVPRDERDGSSCWWTESGDALRYMFA